MTAYTKDEILLSVEGVSLSLGGRLILRDVNAEVRNITRPDCIAGQVVCFLGPSGVGKTVLSRVIAGLQIPDKGKVTLMDRPTAPGRVGRVAQSYPLFDFMTVRENFAVAVNQSESNQFDSAAGDANFRSYPELFGLTKYLDHYPRALSGGTRQRVAIVRQLLCAGHFLVLDEPFSGQDPRMKRRVCELITQVANQDTLNTIIVVTHDVTEGMAIADTVWLMGLEKNGEVYIPGARILEEYDLAAAGLCWRPDITRDHAFLALVGGVKARFEELAP